MGAGTSHGDARAMTTNTLHIENTVRDYATWKPVFDKFDRFRADHGVRSYRLSRSVDDRNRVFIDLDFDSVEAAAEFGRALKKVRATPQSQHQLVSQEPPAVLEILEQRTL